jgi:hypothetical protein
MMPGVILFMASHQLDLSSGSLLILGWCGRREGRGGVVELSGGQAMVQFAEHDVEQLAEINETAGSSGNGPELDTLLLRLHTETACRRGGALALCVNDLDVEQCLVRL